ncbi:LuxR C-terminal-related transcriptional regulator [Actinoplanes sp. NPDC026619]|uniref:helix-turn-helix transcriptional regulator n=1 Tax=Actinoplanes sp. NPDC026619 TaxID=3155798 RepID=UPI0033C9608D
MSDQLRIQLLGDARADPAAPIAAAVCAPGGFGKSTLLAELSQVYAEAGTRDTALLVDDAHRLGDDRLHELAELAEKPAARLIVAYRPWPRPAALTRLAEVLRRNRPVTTLPALTVDEIRDMPRGLAGFIAAFTGGVPRYVSRLVPTLTGPEPPARVPAAALAPFAPELDELGPDLRTLLLAVEAGGSFDLIATLLGADQQAVAELVAAGQATGMLTGRGELIPLARYAIAALGPIAQRVGVRQRLAELQMARGGPVLPLVRHLLPERAEGATAAPAGLGPAFEAAGEEALGNDPALAARLFAAAAEAGRPAAARRALATALTGDLDLAARLADRTVATGSPAQQAEAAYVAAVALTHRGQLDRAADLLRWTGPGPGANFRAVALTGTGQVDDSRHDEGRPRSSRNDEGRRDDDRSREDRPTNGRNNGDGLGNDRTREGGRDNSRTSEDRPGNDRPREGGLGDSRTSEDGPGNNRTREGGLGNTRTGEDGPGNNRTREGGPGDSRAGESWPGEGRRSDGGVDRGLSFADGPPTLLHATAGLMARGVRESLTDAPAAALSTLVQAASVLEPAGVGVLLPDSPAALAALVGLHSADLDVAEATLERAVAAGLGGPLLAPRHLLLQAWCRMLRGQLAGAGRLVTEAAAAGGRDGGFAAAGGRDRLFAAGLRVGLARRDSDLVGLRAIWPDACQILIGQPVDLFMLLPLGELAVAAARLGEHRRVATHLAEAGRLLDRLGDPPLWSAPLHWSRLHAAILAEEPDEAQRQAASLDRMRGAGPYPAALAAAAQGWLAVLTDRIDPDQVEVAARDLAALGLTWDGARLAGQAAIRTTDRKAMALLLDCARTIQGRPGATEPGEPAEQLLSDREREVAALVLAGMTYKQVADRLYLSAKTVEHHIARIRQRLGCTDRRELLARLRELLAETPGAVA